MYIIPQTNLFDYSEIEELGDLERLDLAFDGIDADRLMEKLEAKRGKGRNDYPIRVMWNLLIAMIVFEYKKVSPFLRELRRNAQARRKCGLCYMKSRHLVPPNRVFTGFLKSLANEAEELAEMFKEQVAMLYVLIPGFGEKLAGDGKYIESFAKRKANQDQMVTDNRSENDAQWSTKEYPYTDKSGKKQVKKEHHFGFKAHIICDVATELPVAFSVTAANADEKKEMMKLLSCPLLSEKSRREIAQYFLLDRGYDSEKMILSIKSMGINPIVDIRNCWKDGETTKQYKNTDIVYDAYGNVFHYDVVDTLNRKTGELKREWVPVKMKYEGYDKQKNCLRYSHKGKTHKIYISYDERIFLPVARDSEKFKRLYKGRTAVERLNGRLDRDYMFEEHCIRGLKKMNLMVTLSMIIMNGMAVGKLKNGKEKIRSLKNTA